ncbi:MAG: hypothetical protein HeimC2_25710 [Candidatus Heimdallarchaeota archaeon LC_2]|nr:MAG: hypothetical protein HeimC2_25710 [Candidatus Heimdallarchaeota archaeon LC_2]
MVSSQIQDLKGGNMMTSSIPKRWTNIFILFILLITQLFSQSLTNYHPILSAFGQQNQDYYFYEGFEGLSTADLLLEDFVIEVTGEVPFGITSESVHNDSNSLFVGPSTCSSFCFDNFSVTITISSINLANGAYAISYWRRESFDFGGAIIIFIDGIDVYNEDGADGVWNTGVDTGWYQRLFFFNGPINSLTFWETDLTSSNTIFIDDIVIQDSLSIDPSTLVTTQIDQSTEPPIGTSTVIYNPPPVETRLDIGFLQNGLALTIPAIVIAIIVVSIKKGSSPPQYSRKIPPEMKNQSFENMPNTKDPFCGTCGEKIDFTKFFCGNCGSKW